MLQLKFSTAYVYYSWCTVQHPRVTAGVQYDMPVGRAS